MPAAANGSGPDAERTERGPSAQVSQVERQKCDLQRGFLLGWSRTSESSSTLQKGGHLEKKTPPQIILFRGWGVVINTL